MSGVIDRKGCRQCRLSAGDGNGATVRCRREQSLLSVPAGDDHGVQKRDPCDVVGMNRAGGKFGTLSVLRRLLLFDQPDR